MKSGFDTEERAGAGKLLQATAASAQVPSRILPANASKAVIDKEAERKKLFQHYLGSRKGEPGLSAKRFLAEYEGSLKVSPRLLRKWYQQTNQGKDLDRMTLRARGPKGPTKVKGEVKEIFLDIMSATYGVDAAKKKPRIPKVASLYDDLVFECQRRKLDGIPSKRTLQEFYRKLPDVEKDAVRQLPDTFRNQHKSKAKINRAKDSDYEFSLMYDHTGCDYVTFEDGTKLNISRVIEPATNVILTAAVVRGSITQGKVQGLLCSAAMFESDSDSCYVPVALYCDNETPHRSKLVRALTASTGIEIPDMPPGAPHERGSVEVSHAIANDRWSTRFEAMLRENHLGGSHKVPRGDTEKVIEMIQQSLRVYIERENNRREGGQTRIENFRHRFSDYKQPKAAYLYKLGIRHTAMVETHGTVTVKLFDGSTRPFHNPSLNPGERYVVIELPGLPESVFVYSLAGELIGQANIPWAGGEGRRAAKVQSQVWCTKKVNEGRARRARGAAIFSRRDGTSKKSPKESSPYLNEPRKKSKKAEREKPKQTSTVARPSVASPPPMEFFIKPLTVAGVILP